ncbi:hypothetical protein V2I01_41730 [Micromonospora sp. BRA006-A]|nr:hypothetical protein [Micromonospora sp. BRA006-A]
MTGEPAGARTNGTRLTVANGRWPVIDAAPAARPVPVERADALLSAVADLVGPAPTRSATRSRRCSTRPATSSRWRPGGRPAPPRAPSRTSASAGPRQRPRRVQRLLVRGRRGGRPGPPAAGGRSAQSRAGPVAAGQLVHRRGEGQRAPVTPARPDHLHPDRQPGRGAAHRHGGGGRPARLARLAHTSCPAYGAGRPSTVSCRASGERRSGAGTPEAARTG